MWKCPVHKGDILCSRHRIRRRGSVLIGWDNIYIESVYDAVYLNEQADI